MDLGIFSRRDCGTTNCDPRVLRIAPIFLEVPGSSSHVFILLIRGKKPSENRRQAAASENKDLRKNVCFPVHNSWSQRTGQRSNQMRTCKSQSSRTQTYNTIKLGATGWSLPATTSTRRESRTQKVCQRLTMKGPMFIYT